MRRGPLAESFRPFVSHAPPLWTACGVSGHMLCFACHTAPVRLTEHLRGTQESEQKKEKGMYPPPPPTCNSGMPA